MLKSTGWIHHRNLQESRLKSFNAVQLELNEAKIKLPSGSKELKVDVAKVGGKKVSISYVQNKRNKVDVYLDGSLFSGDAPYKDLKAAENEMKSIKKIMQNMSEEGINIEEIINEINI